MKISFLMYEPVSGLAELDRRMGRVAALGYGGIELTATHPLGCPIDEVVALASRHGLPVVSLLSGWSYSHEGLCLSSPDAGVRDRTAARLVDYVDQAAALRALLVVGLLQGLRSDEPDEGRANERIADGLRRVARAAEGRGGSVV